MRTPDGARASRRQAHPFAVGRSEDCQGRREPKASRRTPTRDAAQSARGGAAGGAMRAFVAHRRGGSYAEHANVRSVPPPAPLQALGVPSGIRAERTESPKPDERSKSAAEETESAEARARWTAFAHANSGVPSGIRTRVAALKGLSPGPG